MNISTNNPNDALDLFEIERRARVMRAEVTRDGIAAMGRWFASRRAAIAARLAAPASRHAIKG